MSGWIEGTSLTFGQARIRFQEKWEMQFSGLMIGNISITKSNYSGRYSFHALTGLFSI